MTLDEKREEALRRLNMLSLHRNVVNDFKKGVLNLTEPNGGLFWLDEEQKKIIRDFEEKTNSVVYHVIHNYTEVGEMLSLLYVSDDKEEWELDEEDLHNGIAFCYVKNLDDDICSEYGTIGIKPMYGGLIRTC